MPAWLSWLDLHGQSGKTPKKRPRKLTFGLVGLEVYACDECDNAQLVAVTPQDAGWFRQWIDGQVIVDGRKR